MGKLISGGVIFFFLLLVLLGSFYTVDQQDRGVILRNGAVSGIASPGMGFKLPLVTSVVDIPVRQLTVVWDGKRAMEAYSQDQQPATISISLTYHIPPADVVRVYSEYGSIDNLVDRLIARRVPQDLKTTFGHYTAVTAIQERNRLNADVQQVIEQDLKASPLVIDSVQIEDIKFSSAYEDAVEQRMLQEVAVQKIQQQADQEKIKAQIVVIQAKAKADAQVAIATAQGKATEIAGKAEAAAIKARGDALRDNPGLVALTTAERWNGVLPTTMVPTGTLPMLSLKGLTPAGN